MRRKSIWEQLGKVLAVVGVVALALLVFFSEHAEKETVPTATPAPTVTVLPTVTVTPTPTEVPEEPTVTPDADAVIELPFVPAKTEEQ